VKRHDHISVWWFASGIEGYRQRQACQVKERHWNLQRTEFSRPKRLSRGVAGGPCFGLEGNDMIRGWVIEGALASSGCC
jgi:hypothetical protein